MAASIARQCIDCLFRALGLPSPRGSIDCAHDKACPAQGQKHGKTELSCSWIVGKCVDASGGPEPPRVQLALRRSENLGHSPGLLASARVPHRDLPACFRTKVGSAPDDDLVVLTRVWRGLAPELSRCAIHF